MTAAVVTGLALVSHSARLSEGVAEVAAQMAPGVRLLAAGGTDEGGLGTSFARVSDAVASLLDAGLQVAILTDLGSATMTAELVVESLPDAERARVVLADGPLVEAAVAGAVAARTGANAAGVADAVARAGASFGVRPRSSEADAAASAGVVERVVALGDPSGLHARPATALAALVAGFDARVTVDGVDAGSALDLMGLDTRGGADVCVRASGPDADAAVAAVARVLRQAPEGERATPQDVRLDVCGHGLRRRGGPAPA